MDEDMLDEDQDMQDDPGLNKKQRDLVDSCPLEPLGARIVCKKKEEEDNPGGLIIPDSAKKEQYLLVVAMGPDCVGKVKVGQHVLIPLYPSEMIAVEANDVKWFMMAEASVPALMK